MANDHIDCSASANQTPLVVGVEQIYRLLVALKSEVAEIHSALKTNHKSHLTVEEVAGLTGRTPYTVRRWVKEKKLAAQRIGGTGPKGRLLIARGIEKDIGVWIRCSGARGRSGSVSNISFFLMEETHDTQTIGRVEESRRLSDLLDHPDQGRYGPLPEAEFKELVDDIRRRGLQHKIEILPENRAGLPANTILDGHQRRQALLEAGEKATMVMVRYDLADADPASVKNAFLKENYQRRQLDMMSRVRIARDVYANDHHLKNPVEWDDPAFRHHLSKLLKTVPRNVQRYCNAAKAPIEIQNALTAGQLPLVVAAEIGLLSDADQNEIVRRINAGEKPKSVAKDFVVTSVGRHTSAFTALKKAIRGLETMHADLAHRLNHVRPHWIPLYYDELRKAAELIDMLMAAGDGTVNGDKK